MDLPQPDSPTTPRVSPLRTSSETPSTACTTPLCSPRRERERTGKCLTMSTVWSRTGALMRFRAALRPRRATPPGAPPAWRGRGGRRPFARATRAQKRRRGQAAVETMRTARLETAALGRREQRRRRARDRREAPDAWPIRSRHRPEKAPRVRVLRVAEELRLRRLLDDLPGVHHDHPLGKLGDNAHVVRDQDDRRAVVALEPLHELEDLCLDGDIERSRRLVCDQERGVAGERHRDHHSLPHPTRELMRIVVRAPVRVRDADLGQQVDGPCPRLSVGHRLVGAQLLLDLPADGVDGRQRGHRVLEDHRDLTAANRPHLALREPHQVAAAVEHLALDDRVGVPDQPHHRQHRDRLAGPGLADDAEHPADRNRQREVVDCLDDAVLGPEGDAEVTELEQRRAGVFRQYAPAGRATRTGDPPSRWPRRRRRPRTSRTP